METCEAKLSSKHQIVVPRAAREALEVRAGDRLLVVVRRGSVILLRKPKRHAKAIEGLGRGLYPAGYLEDERRSWS
jgi:AbrB family looped-hinge helix DNA binding protein